MENLQTAQPIPKTALPSIRFDRNEFASAFGDIGTDLPLVVGVSLAANLDGTSVLMLNCLYYKI